MKAKTAAINSGLTCSHFTFTGNTLSFKFSLANYNSKNYDPGDYEIYFQVAVSGSSAAAHKKEFKLTLKLNDPCHDKLLNVPSFSNPAAYTIYDAQPSLIDFDVNYSRNWSIDFSGCTLRQTITAKETSKGDLTTKLTYNTSA